MEPRWKRRMNTFVTTMVLVSGGVLGAAGSALAADGDYEPIPYDTDADGVADTAVIDRNADGIIDAVVADTNRDGAVDAAQIDLDYDGTADIVFPEQEWQPATPEQELQPDGNFYHNDALDTTISGTPDAGYIDLGDGQSVTWGLG